MKKNKSKFLIAMLVIFWGCGQKEFPLDKNTFYVFKPGDTLFYDGYKTDTFKVDNLNNYILSSDKKDFEIFEVKFVELTKDCKDSAVNYCNADWRRGKSDDFSINFRNTSYYYLNNVPYKETYKIGNHLITNIHVFTNDYPSTIVNGKAVQKVWYSHRLGIVAYELLNGSKYELRESLIK